MPLARHAYESAKVDALSPQAERQVAVVFAHVYEMKGWAEADPEERLVRDTHVALCVAFAAV